MSNLDNLEIQFIQYINNELSQDESIKLEMRLESNKYIWKRWNEFRWNRANETIDLSELKNFLGDKFVWGLDSSWQLAERWNSLPRESKDQVEEFYNDNELYLYNLVIWAASGHRPNYVESSIEFINTLKIKSLIDFGCGVGTDGLIFLEHHKKVFFYDINIKCTEFVKWRLKRRHLDALVVSESDLMSIESIDALWLMDVIEHISDPIDDLLIQVISKSKYLIYDSHSTDDASGRHPFHIDRNPSAIANLLNSLGFRLIKKINTINFYSQL